MGKTTEVKHEHGITVGTHATGWYYSDSMPFEVIKVSPSGKTITIRRMHATNAEGYDYFSNQVYDYSSNEDGATYTVRYTKNGWKTPCNMSVRFGYARKYEDPHF